MMVFFSLIPENSRSWPVLATDSLGSFYAVLDLKSKGDTMIWVTNFIRCMPEVVRFKDKIIMVVHGLQKGFRERGAGPAVLTTAGTSPAPPGATPTAPARSEATRGGRPSYGPDAWVVMLKNINMADFKVLEVYYFGKYMPATCHGPA